jgi:nitrate reductase NapE component
MTTNEFETLRADVRALRTDVDQQFATLRIEWRQEMLTHIHWLVGLFVVQFIATVGATAGIVGWMLNIAGKTL